MSDSFLFIRGIMKSLENQRLFPTIFLLKTKNEMTIYCLLLFQKLILLHTITVGRVFFISNINFNFFSAVKRLQDIERYFGNFFFVLKEILCELNIVSNQIIIMTSFSSMNPPEVEALTNAYEMYVVNGESKIISVIYKKKHQMYKNYDC